MANFNFQRQFHYFQRYMDSSYRTQGVTYRPVGYQHQNFNWESAPRGYYNPCCFGIGQEDIQEICKGLLATNLDDFLSARSEGDDIRFYLMNSVAFLTISSKLLVYERNKMTGGLYIKSKRTMADIEKYIKSAAYYHLAATVAHIRHISLLILN
ncbi:hypothetical protein LOTGIDRAFT_154584 [Lottia gigantea]|uniref:Uncharacterized protein n=1 Tax=Lottia gigantea TaxID=225164 RepID=V4BE50_LOTGI|nr:hypothetical protein LOTGIDRAFT_154584 [Lottia gigantea]ESO87094.1 hypothetical protein LOTGIDRAFT_154584 [Lottia gigantea]